MLEAMEFDQLAGDLSGLTRMAVASRDRLADLTGQIATLRERLVKLLADAEPKQQPDKSPSDAV
jgi:ABC-type transporter Mla subunit MlaD